MATFTDLLASAHLHLNSCDPTLTPLLEKVGPCTLAPDPNGFSVLVRAVISQLISTTAARTIQGRLAKTVGRGGIRPKAILKLSDDELRSVGLSRTKAQAIRELATRVQSGVLPLARLKDLPDEEVAGHLTEVRGIGPWTVNMFLIFGLGRPDIFPVTDMGLRAAVQEHYGLAELPDSAELHRRGDSWRPYRSIATWYMWRSRGFVPQST